MCDANDYVRVCVRLRVQRSEVVQLSIGNHRRQPVDRRRRRDRCTRRVESAEFNSSRSSNYSSCLQAAAYPGDVSGVSWPAADEQFKP